jgi:hypothetical protein
MDKSTLLHKLTGTIAPIQITERENIIIDKCLVEINQREEQLKQSSELLNAYGDRIEKADKELAELRRFRKSIIDNSKALLEDT